MVSNWQNRVEAVETRRKAEKEAKQRKAERRTWKQMVQTQLFPLLNRNADIIRKRADPSWVIHIWTDAPPSDGPLISDTYDEQQKQTNNNKKSGKKGRSGSGSIETPDSGKKGRGRSDSINEKLSSGKKKSHPRSKDAVSEAHDEDATAPRLCRSIFFTGKCEEQRTSKKGICRYAHYPKQCKTLAVALNAKSQEGNNGDDELSLSESACLSSTPDEIAGAESGAMDMVYYFPLKVDKNSETSMNEIIVGELSNKSCTIASIVYVAINDVLLFDRYREGVVLSNDGFLVSVMGETSPAGGSKPDDEVDTEGAVSLTGPVLEHILTFLPDYSAAAASQVCQAWYHEIGQMSPNLWRHLLERRNWPLPDISLFGEPTAPDYQGLMQRLFRAQFLQHYSVVRDVNALQSAMAGLTTRKSVDEREMTFQSFSTRRGAPPVGSTCKGAEIWSTNHLLAAYSTDCSVRLFEAVARTGTSNDMFCRELVCQRLDPYRNTKKRSSQMVAMGLDEEMVGCLCAVSESGSAEVSHILVTISRDDFLLGESNGDGVMEESNLNVINIGAAVLNYLLSMDDGDHRLFRLFDFVEDGGDVAGVEVLVSDSMATCGYGRFMVQVSVSIPMLDDAGEYDPSTLLLVDRKIVLVSARLGAIVWIGDGALTTDIQAARNEKVAMTCFRRVQPSGSRDACSIAVVSSISPAITICEIDADGQTMQSTQLMQAAELARNEILEEGWALQGRQYRPIVITPSDFIISDILVRELANNEVIYKSVISFFPRNRLESTPSYSTLCIEGNCRTQSMANLRDQHIVVMCRRFEETANNSVGGETSQVELHAIVIHVTSRTIIQDVCLLDGFNGDSGGILCHSSDSGGTVGAAVESHGVIMTGTDVRNVGETGPITLAGSSKKKKKKGKASKGNKDPIARGRFT